MTTERPIAELNLLEPEVHERIYDFYAYLHSKKPVYLEPETGVYVVSRYDDVRAMLLDTATFSSRNQSGEIQGENWKMYQDLLAAKGWAHQHTLQTSDPPEHGRYRRLLDQVFNTRRLQALTPHIREVADQVIDGFIDRGECEFVEDFAIPFPGLIISEQFGFDGRDLATFRKWSRSLGGPGGHLMSGEELRAAAELEIEMQRFLFAMFEERRANPQDDLLTRLVQANTDEDSDDPPLSMQELQSVMRQVITGGYGTLTGALTNGMMLLLRHPEQMAKLRADRGLLNGFLEEMLRIDTSNHGLMRTTTRDVMVAGTLIPKGAHVIPRWGAANHDPAKFACPHVFDIERENAASHMSFGAGPHFCVGRVLARMELRIGFTALLDRLTGIELARPLQAPRYQASLVHHVLRELPLKFTKAA